MRKKSCIWAAVLFCLIVILEGTQAWIKKYEWVAQIQEMHFTESAKQLRNPNRGFYRIYGFRIKEEAVDYAAKLSEDRKTDEASTLAMMQINLQEYRNAPLSSCAVENIAQLFQAMEAAEKHWIVRFLYDWYGENEKYEPQDIAIIARHMEQLEPILRKYKDSIFTMQGLFVGNWGEMHGTRYSDQTSFLYLAKKLAQVTDETTFLSVRTPAQWRKITGTANPTADSGIFYGRLGLFNDGMLGGWSDYGTYGDTSRDEAGDFSPWLREEELAFQEQLCAAVPNGGEVIVDNAYNDFETAVADFKSMHITYLNEQYDRAVLEKWAAVNVATEDCFDGMDGLSYMERHLGYRLLISEVQLNQKFGKDTIEAEVILKNVGFAPIYKPCTIRMVMINENGSRVFEQEVSAQFSELTGGHQSDKENTIVFQLPLPKEEAHFSLQFEIVDSGSGREIQLANEQSRMEYGYSIGQFEMEHLHLGEICRRFFWDFVSDN